jgi:hypothetical protein
VARLEVSIPGAPGAGLIAIYKDGPAVEIAALDAAGRQRPEWAAAFSARPVRARRMSDEDARDRDWPALVRRLATKLDPNRRPEAIAAIVVM